MNVEKTIEFLLEQQARAEVRFQEAEERAKWADKRLDRLEWAVSQTNRVVTRLVSYGVSLRSDVRRQDKAMLRIESGVEKHDRAIEKHDRGILRIEAAVRRLAESQPRTDHALQALIKVVDRTIRGNGKS